MPENQHGSPKTHPIETGKSSKPNLHYCCSKCSSSRAFKLWPSWKLTYPTYGRGITTQLPSNGTYSFYLVVSTHFEKYACQNWSSSPNSGGEKWKNLWVATTQVEDSSRLIAMIRWFVPLSRSNGTRPWTWWIKDTIRGSSDASGDARATWLCAARWKPTVSSYKL